QDIQLAVDAPSAQVSGTNSSRGHLRPDPLVNALRPAVHQSHDLVRVRLTPKGSAVMNRPPTGGTSVELYPFKQFRPGHVPPQLPPTAHEISRWSHRDIKHNARLQVRSTVSRPILAAPGPQAVACRSRSCAGSQPG